jgi:hypothetical protein
LHINRDTTVPRQGSRNREGNRASSNKTWKARGKEATGTRPGESRPEDKVKVIEHLREHGKNRPMKRKTLEAYIASSVLGGNISAKAVRGLVAGLENEKIIKFSDDKIEYKLPKRKK